MHINAKFEKLTKIPGDSKLVQGVKYGRVPRNAVAGGNGSFIVAERAKLILTVRTEEGKCIQKDIYLEVKDHTSKRITPRFRDEIEATMQNFNFIVEGEDILNLDEVLEKLE